MTGRYTASSRLTYSNAGDYQIPDPGTVLSPITVSGRSGTAPSNATVSLDIRHPYRGDFTVDLIAPDNTVVNLHNYAGGSTDNLIGSYTVNLAGKPLNGNWYLRVHDAYAGDYGYINSWSVNF
ncbi:proprotein convertase P-domain-containing protein [Montanilutibacter psychrotolerans]|uniref:proprotein convertase P-domain-containing protein n=1 Tax=Montanilutibacter psychrotolerans TaxID=1327343 RepID=UPI003CCD38F5